MYFQGLLCHEHADNVNFNVPMHVRIIMYFILQMPKPAAHNWNFITLPAV